MDKFRFVFSVILFCSFLFYCTNTYSQKVVYRVKEKDVDLKKNGPNKTFFHSLILEYSIFLNAKANNLNFIRSFNSAIGHFHKIKLHEQISIIAESKYFFRNTVFRSPENYIGEFQNKKTRSIGISPAILFRINKEKKRGNHLGNYIDFGISESIFVMAIYSGENFNHFDFPVQKKTNYLKSYPTLIPSQTSMIIRVGLEGLTLGYEYFLNNSWFVYHKGLFLNQPKHKISFLFNL